MNIIIPNSEGKPFLYEWIEGTSTVNVSTHPTHGPAVNFDVFTNDSIIGEDFYEICRNHLVDREEADARYQGTHSKEELLYGII